MAGETGEGNGGGWWLTPPSNWSFFRRDDVGCLRFMELTQALWDPGDARRRRTGRSVRPVRCQALDPVQNNGLDSAIESSSSFHTGVKKKEKGRSPCLSPVLRHPCSPAHPAPPALGPVLAGHPRVVRIRACARPPSRRPCSRPCSPATLAPSVLVPMFAGHPRARAHACRPCLSRHTSLRLKHLLTHSWRPSPWSMDQEG